MILHPGHFVFCTLCCDALFFTFKVCVHHRKSCFCICACVLCAGIYAHILQKKQMHLLRSHEMCTRSGRWNLDPMKSLTSSMLISHRPVLGPVDRGEGVSALIYAGVSAVSAKQSFCSFNYLHWNMRNLFQLKYQRRFLVVVAGARVCCIACFLWKFISFSGSIKEKNIYFRAAEIIPSLKMQFEFCSSR